MRTRFHTNFFNTPAASHPSHPPLNFLRFPPPHLPPSSDPFTFNYLTFFDQITSIHVSPQLETLSVTESLSKFFADVLPHTISTDVNQPIVTVEASEEKDKEDVISNTIFSLVEFEPPELCTSLEDSRFLHEQKLQLFFEVTDTVSSSDLLDFSLAPQRIMDIHKSIFSVEDICPEFKEEHKSDVFKDGSLVKGQISSDLTAFPLLEIDETSMEINSYTCDEKHIIFESNDLQKWMLSNELKCDSKELLLSTEFNILENLLNISSLKCHKIEVACVNMSPEYIMNALEDPLSQLALEKPQFFDTNTSHYVQVFSDTKFISDEEHYEQMFGNTTFCTFNDLIVAHELVLTDDSFKSLPVPIISDHEKLSSVQMIFGEIFMKLKLQPSSTSDDIYLDWHLLDDDICSHSKRTSLKMFEDIDTYCISADMNAVINSSDSLLVVLEFVLSDACSNEQKTKENIEVLNIERSGSLMESVVNDKIDSSDISKKMASGEVLVDNKVNKSRQLVESMPQFDDLDFFLNPLEATYVKRQKTSDKILEMDCTLPVITENNPVVIHDASRKQQQSLDNEIHSIGDFPSTHVEENNSMNSLEAAYEEVPQLPLVNESKKVNTNTPDVIIIVNTRNGETDMIISRRSTYQKILAMEKDGVQVVERDLNQPVDVIISAAVCLVLYDNKNIRKKTNSSDGGASPLPSSVDNIAANVLTSLSFAFSTCILVFEGEVGFLGGIMESSDELYAAAASLGLDLQLFYSYSSETTDEIILNCIKHAEKSTRGLYLKMPESETLAESFLSQFTSLNPLSAHAILSSVGTLIEFFEMSHQQRVCALQKYLVPEASIELFSALCRYGEREDSKSGTTDCCSSVSSGHDSGYCCPKINHEQKKRKYIRTSETTAMPVDDLFQFEKSNDVLWDPSKSVDSHNDVMWDLPSSVDSRRFWSSEAVEVSNGVEKSNAAFDEIYFSQGQRPDARMMPNRPSLTDTFFNQSKKVHMPIVDMLGSRTNRGEIINIDDNAMAGEDFSFLHPEKISPEWFSLPSYPTAAEINSDLDSWIPTEDNGETSSEGFIVNSQAGLMSNDPCYGRTPLSKAIISEQPQKGSPWTIDFLNKIKEKSRMRHQSLPNISSAPCFGYSGNSSKYIRKRKSPSILDFYRYNSSSTVKSTEHKRQKGPIKAPSSSKPVKPTPSFSQTWTPIDKRAKRKLTFATNGSKGQSKLIWTDKVIQL